MILERFYDERLAQASYLVGCAATHEALVIDPARNVAPYLAAAQRHGLNITHVTETHIHADFVSGSLELHEKTGAQMLLSAEGGTDWQYAYAAEHDAKLLHDGDHFMVGNVRFEVLHTPGHTPEHLSFMFTDTAATEVAMGIFTGDFIFVGDVGRPDLLEKAAGIAGTMEAGARDLYQSIRRTDDLPGHLQIWPGHGAGSACGKALGAIPSSTLDYERAVNWAFQLDEKAFVGEVLAGQPEPPTYFAEMKRVNREGPNLSETNAHAAPRPIEELREVLEQGLTVIDTRPWDDFKRAHVGGTINIPIAERSFATWAGWLVDYQKPFYLLVDPAADHGQIDEARTALRSIGLDKFAGYFETPGLVGAPISSAATISEITASELNAAPDDYIVIDVRGRSEWDEAHIPDATHAPLGYLEREAEQFPKDRPLVLHCQTGVRSAVGTSVLEALGFDNVLNLVGGFESWQQSSTTPGEHVEPALA